MKEVIIIKKYICIIVTILIFVNIIYLPATSFAEETTCITYTGSTTTNYGYKPNCKFTLNSIKENRFRGEFAADGLGVYSFNENVSGTFYSSNHSFTCIFTVRFFNGRYYSNVTITAYPEEGYCDCYCAGSWHMEDFRMYGNRFIYGDNNSSITGNEFYNEDDMILCANLSALIYDSKTKRSFVNDNLDYLNQNHIETNDIRFNNYIFDINSNNVAFALMSVIENDLTAKMIVVIRGTYNDEWQGNMQITGDEYNSNCITHYNFDKATNSIKQKIYSYYNYLNKNYKYVDLLITGHSRGAAVANLYSKYAIDNINGVYNSDIPLFHSVCAYTFACPNVAKYQPYMENYNSIFNFEFYEDLIPTIPLTNPTSGWNYWKYGKTLCASLIDSRINGILTNKNKVINSKCVDIIHDDFSQWDSVEKYYNKKIFGYFLNNVGLITKSTTLYNFAYDATGTFKSHSLVKKYEAITKLKKRFGIYPELNKIIIDAGKNIDSISGAHSQYTYKNVINSFGDAVFNPYYYSDATSNLIPAFYTSMPNSTDINEKEVITLINLYSQSNNSEFLGWNLDDPSTWTGVTWNEDGNVESIDLSYKNLDGTLDLSNFSSLKSLNLSGNNLTSVNLDNCSSLEEFDCSFNKLTSLDLSDCTNLKSVICCYNYLDTHEGSTLYNKLDDLMFSDCYVNYYPQSVPDNATFDTTELNALKTFANTNNNNTALNWLDDSGNIDTEKLQNNVLFEYYGSKHRVVAIDISDLDVSGALDLTHLSLLQELYCENTKITTLNINGCTKLETLKCDGCELTSITLPSNANAKTSSLYDVSCEYNYLDTSIFTQDIIKYVEFKAGGEIQYKNQKGDSSALQAALYFANKLDEKDYSEETFKPFKELIDECNAYNYDNLYLTQEDIDEITTNILVSMYELKAYFKVNISSSNGSFTVNDEKSSSSYKQSLLYGTTVTLNAVPNEGYNFAGWYDTVNNIYMSKNPEYTFKVSTNTDLKAVFIAEGSATLTFVNHSNWVAGTFTKSTAEWAEVTSINDLLPEVPFRFGYSNGRWVYDEQEVLSKLQTGEDVVIGAEYDEDDASFPTPPVAKDKPVLELYYKYNEENTLGTFMMAAGFPENIKIESVGIAFYYKKADMFDPRDNFTLLLNNKMMIGRFNTEQLEDIYIINMHNMTSAYNWAARGFVTYYDSDGNLVTEYSNQINIIDRQNADEIKA